MGAMLRRIVRVFRGLPLPTNPNHVWMLDLTEVPGSLRLFSFRLTVVLDVFSRAPVAARCSLKETARRPSSC